MEDTPVEPIRNIAMVSNAGAGKTSLCEALLYVGRAVPALGSVAQGTTVSDYEPESLQHRTSVSTSLLQFTWNHVHVTLIDPPGALELMGESLAALRAVDAVVIVLTPGAGVRSELARLWTRINDLKLPSLVFLNGLDKDGATFDAAMESCRTQFGCVPIPMVVPVNPGANLENVLDVRLGKLVRSGPTSSAVEQVPIPSELQGAMDTARTRLIEAVAESDEALLESYVAQGTLSQDEVIRGLRNGIRTRQFLPVFGGSATHNVGVWSLLDAIVSLVPSPAERGVDHPWRGVHPETNEVCERAGGSQEPFSAVIFKTLIDPFVGRLSYCRVLSGALHADTTVWNATRQIREKVGHCYWVFGKRHQAVESARAGEIVAIAKLKDTQTGDTLCQEQAPICYPGLGLPKPILSFAIEATTTGEIDKVSLGLHRLIEEDPTLEFVRNADTKEMVLSGMGQFHIELALEKLRRKFGASVTVHLPKVPYRETLKTTAHAQGKYKKQTGGHGQYGDCWLEVAPQPRGHGFTFENRVVGGAIPRNFIPAVEKGVVEAMHHGALGGFPVVDVQVAVYDGSYHVVDSSEMSFKIAGSMAFKKAMEEAHPVLLEPMMTVEIDVPTDAVGAVMGDVTARRGRIQSVQGEDHTEHITAIVPLAELLTYPTALNAMTGGRGSYVMGFAQYDEVPKELAARILERHRAEHHASIGH